MEAALWLTIWTFAPALFPQKPKPKHDGATKEHQHDESVMTETSTATASGSNSDQVIMINTVSDLGAALAKADRNTVDATVVPGVVNKTETASVSPSITTTSLDTLNDSPPKSLEVVNLEVTSPTSSPSIPPVEFTEHEKELLRSVMTPVNDYVHFTKKQGTHYMVLLEARGGTDKDPATGHRRDSIPIASQIAAQANCASGLLQYLEDAEGPEQDMVQARQINSLIRQFLLQTCTAVIVRVNPGTLSTTSQSTLDAMLSELAASGIHVLTAPHVIRQMGAKDSLVKIRNLRCGLPDTSVYYDAASFADGFVRSIAFRPRVIKQNRGSQGEGIWICKLRDGNYCDNFGDAVVSLDTELELLEANDNHVEYHTVGEFLEFCINGRTDKSGEWASTGSGRYLEGGVDAGAMLVDQRFLPRIVEGEVRCNMVGNSLVNIVHKVPTSGGLSCTLQSGADYTSYAPDHPKFAKLVEAFYADLPNIMSAFDMEGEPLPLLWTADFIFDTAKDGSDVFYVGEFNCSCVGITKDLHLAGKVAQTAISTCGIPVEM